MVQVSVIVPCLNEEATIEFLLDAIRGQCYPQKDMEVVIADGMSVDRTRERIANYQMKHPEMKILLVDNPKRIIPSGVNCAIKASSGNYIIRLDAHSIPNPDYVTQCVKHLQADMADNVGGLWVIKPRYQTWIAKSIAVAAAHPIGVGDAFYRFSRTAGYVDTVPFGSFKRQVFERVGFLNENLKTNEDYEFNVRIHNAGGRVYFDPQICSTYFSRSSLKELAKQYFRYGYWKYQMLLCFPNTLRWRQALPPLFVISIVILSIASLFLPLARFLLAGILVLYALILVGASLKPALKNKDIGLAAGIPIAIAVMHGSWGTGFLWSVVKSLVRG